MSQFSINFSAQTTGLHYIGYRTYTDPPNIYHVITVNVTGAIPQNISVDIDVPGNLYCAYDDIEYTGYIIAACQDQTDGNGDGIPDLAMQWTVILAQQTDPCIKSKITCDNVSIADITVNDGGTGYTTANVAISGGGGVGGAATAVLGLGIITAVVGDGNGAGYAEADGTQLNIPLIGIGQVPLTGGTLGTVDVTFALGAITAITLNTPGSGYISSENPVTIDLSALVVGTAPATEEAITLTCANDFADVIHEIAVIDPGSGYTSAPSVVITGDGIDGDATAVLEAACPDLDLRDYDCENHTDLSDVPVYSLALTESLKLCADITALGTLPSNFTFADEGNCHCESCKDVTVDASAAKAGTGKLSYQTCWDNNGVYSALMLITREINWGDVIQLGCIILDTLTIDDGTLDVSPITTSTHCVF